MDTYEYRQFIAGKPHSELNDLMLAMQAIWRSGDRDECSLKHIGHGTASIVAFDTWTKLQDYATPGCWTKKPQYEGDTGYRPNYDQLIKTLTDRWEVVEREIRSIGVQRFVDLTSHIHMYPSMAGYVGMYYDDEYYAPAIEQRGIDISALFGPVEIHSRH